MISAGTAPTLSSVRASADDRSDLESARERVAAALQDARATAARIADAEVREAGLSDRIARVRSDMRDVRREIRFLEPIARRRAVEAYQGLDPNGLEMFAVGGSLLDGVRAAELLSVSKRQEDEAIDRLGALREDLVTKQRGLTADREELDAVLSGLAAERSRISDELSAAQATERHIEARIAAARRRRAAARRAAARRAALMRAAAAATTTVPGRSSGTAGFGEVICPIDGPTAFVDTWHAPRPGGRLHEGVDIFSTEGSPNVAVVSGFVTHGTGAREGNGVFLYGDDGNSYWYFHLQSFATGEVHVDQGDVIGYTGDTGNAPEGAYHTHFEYHPGHGEPVDPYPLVNSVC